MLLSCFPNHYHPGAVPASWVAFHSGCHFLIVPMILILFHFQSCCMAPNISLSGIGAFLTNCENRALLRTALLCTCWRALLDVVRSTGQHHFLWMILLLSFPPFGPGGLLALHLCRSMLPKWLPLTDWCTLPIPIPRPLWGLASSYSTSGSWTAKLTSLTMLWHARPLLTSSLSLISHEFTPPLLDFPIQLGPRSTTDRYFLRFGVQHLPQQFLTPFSLSFHFVLCTFLV